MRNRVEIPIDEIMAAVGLFSEDIADALADEVLEEAQKSAAFVDKTGKLRKSGKKQKSKFDKETRIVKFGAPHSHLIEHGHNLVKGKSGRIIGHVPAHPFLGPAADAVEARAPEIIKNMVGDFTFVVG